MVDFEVLIAVFGMQRLFLEGVKFSLTSKDGDQGYPGTVQVTATYSLIPTPSNKGASLRLVMDGKLMDDKITPIVMAQHSYFNLASHDDKNGLLNHKLTMPCRVLYSSRRQSHSNS